MKTIKTKHPTPMVRTVGQLKCVNNVYSTTPFQKVSGAGKKLAEPDDPWSRLHQTFSNGPALSPSSPRNFPSTGEQPTSDRAGFYSITNLKEHETASPQLSVAHKTSESGVQVNMFHCKECRRHIKYGKAFKEENSCTESDSENNQMASCSTCQRKEDLFNLPIDDVNNVQDEEKSENEDPISQHEASPRSNDSTPRDCASPNENNILTPKLDNLPKNDEIPQENQNTQVGESLDKQGGNHVWLLSIKLMTVAIVILPFIIHIIQVDPTDVLSDIYFYLKHIVIQEENEEPSLIERILDALFGVTGITKPLPLYLYLF